jgi:hypothetical protein
MNVAIVLICGSLYDKIWITNIMGVHFNQKNTLFQSLRMADDDIYRGGWQKQGVFGAKLSKVI